MDNEMFLMSVALYKHEQQSSSLEASANKEKLIPSRVGSVLISSRTWNLSISWIIDSNV